MLMKACSISLLLTLLCKSILKTVTLAFIPGLLLHDFQLSSSLSGNIKKLLLEGKGKGLGQRKINNGLFYRAIFPLCLLNAFISDFITESKGV